MRFSIILLSVFCFALSPVFAAQRAVSPLQKLIINRNQPKLYKPTKLEIGQKNIFKIQAKPGANVSLLLSYDKGSSEYYGKQLRLGKIFKTISGKVPTNGIVNLEYDIANDKFQVGRKVYFEAFIWQKEDYSDIKLAKIIGANGREININSVYIRKPKTGNGIGLLPDLGIDPEAIKAVGGMSGEDEKHSDSIEIDRYDMDYTNYTPAGVRNMKSPDYIQNLDKE